MSGLAKVTTCASTEPNSPRRQRHEVVVRRVVGPQGEHPAGVQVAVQGEQAPQGCRTRRGWGAARAAGCGRCRAAPRARARGRRPPNPPGLTGEREEVALDQPGARVGGERRGIRQQVLLVPADDRGEGLDDDERAHPWLLERGDRGVPQPQPADDDVQLVAGAGRQPQPGQLDLGDGEQARHEELVAELDLVDVDLQRPVEPPAQADLAHLGVLPVQLLEVPAHRSTSRSRRAAPADPSPHGRPPAPGSRAERSRRLRRVRRRRG